MGSKSAGTLSCNPGQESQTLPATQQTTRSPDRLATNQGAPAVDALPQALEEGDGQHAAREPLGPADSPTHPHIPPHTPPHTPLPHTHPSHTLLSHPPVTLTSQISHHQSTPAVDALPETLEKRDGQQAAREPLGPVPPPPPPPPPQTPTPPNSPAKLATTRVHRL